MRGSGPDVEEGADTGSIRRWGRRDHGSLDELQHRLLRQRRGLLQERDCRCRLDRGLRELGRGLGERNVHRISSVLPSLSCVQQRRLSPH